MVYFLGLMSPDLVFPATTLNQNPKGKKTLAVIIIKKSHQINVRCVIIDLNF